MYKRQAKGNILPQKSQEANAEDGGNLQKIQCGQKPNRFSGFNLLIHKKPAFRRESPHGRTALLGLIPVSYTHLGCNLQFGGDDQWSNMLGGTELIRKKLGKDASAMTITLLLNSEGKKMGKTQSGAVWLDPEKTSPYDFFQYWRNVDDADVIKCMKLLTFVSIEEIEEMERTLEGAQLNTAKERLALSLIHICGRIRKRGAGNHSGNDFRAARIWAPNGDQRHIGRYHPDRRPYYGLEFKRRCV